MKYFTACGNSAAYCSFVVYPRSNVSSHDYRRGEWHVWTQTDKEGESRRVPPFELRGGVKATRVDALQARVPHLLNDARGDPIMRLALRSRRGHVQYVNGAVQRCGDTSISSGSIRISEGGNNNVTKKTHTPAALDSHCARPVAFADWRGMRRWSVRSERRSSQDSSEPIMLPRNVRMCHSFTEKEGGT